MENVNKRKLRTRAKINYFSKLPRLSVFRSDKHIYAQVIERETGKIIAQASDIKIEKGTKTEKSQLVGQEIAQACLKAKVNQVVFDRGPYRYHGRVKALAESAKEGKLII